MRKLSILSLSFLVVFLPGCCGLAGLTPEGCPIESEAYEERRQSMEQGCDSGYYSDEDEWTCTEWEDGQK